MGITESSFKSNLTRTFSENGISSLLNIEIADKFFFLTKRLLEENEKYNLTAIKEPSKIILNHYVDSITLSNKLPKGASVIDIGCGAGFPTLPLAIVRDDLKILAVDSTAKRINYVKETASMLSLDNVTAIAMRAEDGAKEEKFRERFDFATARAVSEMRVLLELCMPYVKIGGYMLAMKGKNAEFELASSKKAIAMLGGRDAKIENVTLKGDGEILTHPIISVKKVTKTPLIYPRAYAQITKKPL